MAFKDWWQSKPYWLKGGIVSVSFFTIVTFLIFLIPDRGGLGTFPYWALLLFGLSLEGIEVHYLFFLDKSTMLSVILQSLINTFLLGTLIGWIVGKIKSK